MKEASIMRRRNFTCILQIQGEIGSHCGSENEKFVCARSQLEPGSSASRIAAALRNIDLFKSRQDRAGSNLVWWKVSVERGWNFKIPSHPTHSVLL